MSETMLTFVVLNPIIPVKLGQHDGFNAQAPHVISTSAAMISIM